jgi:hypothetical protein
VDRELSAEPIESRLQNVRFRQGLKGYNVDKVDDVDSFLKDLLRS